MFKLYGLLPDEIGRQKPYNIFFILDGLTADKNKPAEISKATIPKQYWAFYGL